MKALGILLVSATLVFAGCTCDCNDKVGENGFKVEDGNSTVTTNDGTNKVTTRGNTSTNDNGDASADNTTNKTDDPRTYGTSSGGVGYRTDTLDEYEGIDGSARDKGDLDEVPNPK